jgi:hypothetical protein
MVLAPVGVEEADQTGAKGDGRLKLFLDQL